MVEEGEVRTETIDRLKSLVGSTRPVSTAEQRTLPMLPALAEVLPESGLRRGSTVQVEGPAGATSLALTVSAGPTRAGSWMACVGLPELGWAAAGELGVDLERVVVVRSDEASFTTATAALIDAFDVVLCGMPGSVSFRDARRLTARAKERGSVLVLVASSAVGVGAVRRRWPEATDVNLKVLDAEWTGMGNGSGHLRERRLTVQVGGRRGFAVGRHVELWLPGTRDVRPGTVLPFRRVG